MGTNTARKASYGKILEPVLMSSRRAQLKKPWAALIIILNLLRAAPLLCSASSFRQFIASYDAAREEVDLQWRDDPGMLCTSAGLHGFVEKTAVPMSKYEAERTIFSARYSRVPIYIADAVSTPRLHAALLWILQQTKMC